MAFRYFGIKRTIATLLLSTVLVVVVVPAAYLIVNRGQDKQGVLPQSTLVTYAAENSIEQRFEQNTSDINTFSAGRVGIWKAYINQLNIRGNNQHKVFDVGTRNRNYGAHNAPLEIAYRCGIPAGILFAVLEIIAIAYAIVRFFCISKCRDYDFFVIPAIIGCVIISMFESIVIPFRYDVLLMFFIAFGLVLLKKGKYKGKH